MGFVGSIKLHLCILYCAYKHYNLFGLLLVEVLFLSLLVSVCYLYIFLVLHVYRRSLEDVLPLSWPEHVCHLLTF